MKKPLTCETIVPKRFMRIGSYTFTCPYCTRNVPRGGKAEGFRKAGFASHVAQCWEILLYLAGYLPGSWVEGGHSLVPLNTTDPKLMPYVERRTRAIKAHIRKRAREGFTPSI